MFMLYSYQDAVYAMGLILPCSVNALDDKAACRQRRQIIPFYFQHTSVSKQQNQFWLLASINFLCLLLRHLILRVYYFCDLESQYSVLVSKHVV